jgi:hypothetical protein
MPRKKVPECILPRKNFCNGVRRFYPSTTFILRMIITTFVETLEGFQTVWFKPQSLSYTHLKFDFFMCTTG